MARSSIWGALLAGTVVSVACSDDRPPPSLVGTGGESSGKAGNLNRAGTQADAGQSTGGVPDGDGGELVLLAQSERNAHFDMPDNVTVAPDGTVYFCEDGRDRNGVRAVDARGRLFDFARNALSRSEIAGVCFAPDGGTMFLNLQTDGMTLAVRGPFTAA